MSQRETQETSFQSLHSEKIVAISFEDFMNPYLLHHRQQRPLDLLEEDIGQHPYI